MDDLEHAADKLEKATNELVKRAEELVKRSEELNRQLLRLAEVLIRPNPITSHEAAPRTLKPATPPEIGKAFQGLGILDEVKEFLDGPEDQAGLSGEDPRD